VTYLDKILERHREFASSDDRSLDALMSEVASRPPTRGFRAALSDLPDLAVIAEIKRRSPSKGDLNADLDPAEMARSYSVGGASCLSVLTDVEFFGGSIDDLQVARAACTLPVLRKDFTVSAHDVVDARLMGADCVLLIAAAMSVGELGEFYSLSTEIGLDALVEVHDEAELEAAMSINATLIGVNQRDLVTFEVDHERARRLAAAVPTGAIKVAESGVRGGDDARALKAAGFDAVLVGETLVVANDPAAAVADLKSTKRSPG
jgi:indole-3-glycerol phosphate synthase